MIKLPSRYKRTGGTESGGFGEVMFCEDTHLSRPVAIKFLQDKAQMRRLWDEMHALLMMRSKHVVQVYDIVDGGNGNVGIVEEYVDGKDLLESDFPCSSVECYLKTLWQIASGISDIHAAGIVHRDIKPKNMKIDREGILKIFDFGLARDDGPEAVTTGFVGTHGFAAPELYSGNDVAFSTPVDTYAFGALALFLVSRKLPKELLARPPLPPLPNPFSHQPFAIPAELSKLLERCLATVATDRPPMSTLRDEIARHLLLNKHQALAVYNGTTSHLNSVRRNVKLRLPSVGEVEVAYNGLRFLVTAATGEVAINNGSAQVGMSLPNSCVVSIGHSHRKSSSRAFITFDISNPEVVL